MDGGCILLESSNFNHQTNTTDTQNVPSISTLIVRWQQNDMSHTKPIHSQRWQPIISLYTQKNINNTANVKIILILITIIHTLLMCTMSEIINWTTAANSHEYSQFFPLIRGQHCVFWWCKTIKQLCGEVISSRLMEPNIEKDLISNFITLQRIRDFLLMRYINLRLLTYLLHGNVKWRVV